MNNRQRTYPPSLPGANVETYKTLGDVQMNLWIFTPEGHSESDSRPAIVFFFGGGFRTGNPAQFAHHCEYLANRGMVAITADYRVLERHGTSANLCVSDAKSAVRWIRTNASRLGIDSNRLAAGGGSAGGHLAAATATLEEHNDSDDDLSISAQPNALVLFNPGLVGADIPGKFSLTDERRAVLEGRCGGSSFESMSPYHGVKSGTVPAIIFHGTGDTTVPYQTSSLFWERMLELGNRCELVGYDGATHGFFNIGRDNNASYVDTVNKMDAFLVSLGYLQAGPIPAHHK